jgi:hypothetical protein
MAGWRARLGFSTAVGFAVGRRSRTVGGGKYGIEAFAPTLVRLNLHRNPKSEMSNPGFSAKTACFPMFPVHSSSGQHAGKQGSLRSQRVSRGENRVPSFLSWYQVPGTWYLVQVPGTCTRYLYQVHGCTWPAMVPGTIVTRYTRANSASNIWVKHPLGQHSRRNWQSLAEPVPPNR